MIGYYKKSIIELLTLIHNSKNRPYEHPEIWKEVQEKLIKQISKSENKIREVKRIKKELKSSRKDPNNLLTKDESLLAKNKLNYIEYLIEEYRYLLKIYKNIGDAIAFTFIHKLDIKPQNFKQSPGFITEKSGFSLEKRAFRYAFKKGGIAILNDLTSVLKYCDLTLISKDGFLPIEIKSSEKYNTKLERQKSNAEKIFSYIVEDKTDMLYGIEGPAQRIPFQSEEVNYISEFNELIEISKQKGYASKLVEPGVLYIVAHKAPNKKNTAEEKLELLKLKEPNAFFLNGMKFPEQGYYPFSLSITNPENYFDFLQGKFVITILIDFSIISKIANKYNYSFQQINVEGFPFEFKSLKRDKGVEIFRMSYHFFSRTIFEFVSLSWLLKDTFTRFKQKHLNIEPFNSL